MNHFIVINLATGSLFYFEGNQMLGRYTVAIGRPATPTPPGTYQITEKEILPLPEPGGADLGSRRLILSSAKTCVHGSWRGPVMGQVSGGCVRMRNEDIEELFPKVEVGTPVIMIGE